MGLFDKLKKKDSSVLITDEDDVVSNAFYKDIGLSEKCNGYPIKAYFRVRSTN